MENSAKLYPDKVAVIDEYKQLTFQEIRNEAVKIARQIRKECGDIRNEPVAVYMRKSTACIAAFMGIAYSGNFYCPIDVNSPTDRINRIITALQPKAVICEENMEGDLFRQIRQISINGIEEEGNDLSEKYYEEVLDIDPLYVLFTSGSTGQPKGVVISHKGVIDYTEWLADTFAFDSDTIFGNQAPFYFDNSVLDIYSMLRNGSTMIIIPERFFSFPRMLMDYLTEKKINTLFWVPSALITVAHSGVLATSELNALKKVMFCGEVMPNRQLNIWRYYYPDIMYVNLYGPTEITDVCTYYIVDREFGDEEPLPIGKACKNTEILVLNDQNEQVKTGETGELCVRGTCLSMGYFGDTLRTEEVFVQNPLNKKYKDMIYRTGDLVTYNDRKEIIYICRKDFQIKHQGHRIELGEIEAAASAIKEVGQSCALYDENNKKIILVCKTEKNVNEKGIYIKLKEKLPKYMLPSTIKIINEMPLNPNGKIDRNRLKKEVMTNE